MPVTFLPFVVLALAAPETAASSKAIYVTGHPWAPFISPMGEPFRAHSPGDDALADWFHQADRNHDGFITLDEMVADAERFFATLDTNHDGEIDPDELDHYEWEVAPEIQVNSRTRRAPGQPAPVVQTADLGEDQPTDRRKRRGIDDDSSLGMGGALQGAARYGLLNIPEPVAAADADFNRSITLEEFRQAAVARFQLLDIKHEGRLTLDELEAMRPNLELKGHRHKRNDNAPDARVGNPLPPGP